MQNTRLSRLEKKADEVRRDLPLVCERVGWDSYLVGNDKDRLYSWEEIEVMLSRRNPDPNLPECVEIDLVSNSQAKT